MSKKLEKNLCICLAVASVLFSLLLYYKSLGYYFFQDDFYEILISKVTDTSDFIKLFSFLENRSSYRPIGLQFYFFISQTFFGLNPLFYRIIIFVMFISTYFLIATTVGQFLKNRLSGYVTASLWITSSIHFLSLSWIAAAWLIIGSFFFFASALAFLTFIRYHLKVFYSLSILLFMITLGSFEFFVAWPVLMGTWMILFTSQGLKKTLTLLSPFIAITALYIVARLSFASLPNIDEYKVGVNINTPKHLFWYFFWSFNIPEEFKKQIIGNLVQFNTIFLKDFMGLVIKSFLVLFVILILGILVPTLKSLRENREMFIKALALSTTWFLVALLPVLILPNHSFAMYLAIPSIGLYSLIGYLLSQKGSLLIIAALFLAWFYSSFITVDFYRKSFWVYDSQNFARQFSQQIKKQYVQLPKGAVIYYPLEDRRHQQAILNDNAIKVLYDDSSIRIFFDKISLDKNIAEGTVNSQSVLEFSPNL